MSLRRIELRITVDQPELETVHASLGVDEVEVRAHRVALDGGIDGPGLVVDPADGDHAVADALLSPRRVAHRIAGRAPRGSSTRHGVPGRAAGACTSPAYAGPSEGRRRVTLGRTVRARPGACLLEGRSRDASAGLVTELVSDGASQRQGCHDAERHEHDR